MVLVESDDPPAKLGKRGNVGENGDVAVVDILTDEADDDDDDDDDLRLAKNEDNDLGRGLNVDSVRSNDGEVGAAPDLSSYAYE